MESKYFTKSALIAANNAAKNAGCNYIDPEFLNDVPDQFKFPVCPALPIPMERGWVRCVVTVGRNLSDDVHHLLLDMPGEEYEMLPTVKAERCPGSTPGAAHAMTMKEALETRNESVPQFT
jgi:hypothetical protein